MCHSNTIVIDIKTFWRLLAVFMARKAELYTKTARISRQLVLVYRTRIIVNGCYWNTCKLLFTKTRTLLRRLTLVSVMWTNPKVDFRVLMAICAVFPVFLVTRRTVSSVGVKVSGRWRQTFTALLWHTGRVLRPHPHPPVDQEVCCRMYSICISCTFLASNAPSQHECTWHQHNQLPHFFVSSRHTCSGSLIPDYLLDINWLSPVDLAVVPLLRLPKNYLIDRSIHRRYMMAYCCWWHSP